MRKAAGFLCCFAVGFASAAPLCAMSLSDEGGAATLSGRIDVGDDEVFKAFLAQRRATPIKVLHLSSRGGLISASFSIARQIRAAHIATSVDATSVVCDSSCTLVFAGGVQRYYTHGEQIFEGFTSMTGLGFHTAHVKGNGFDKSSKSEAGTEWMRAFYREMGQPRAAELMDQAAFNTVFRPNGKTALALRIATSLGDPPQ